MDCSLPGSSVGGILQARILEWVAVPSSRDLPKPGIEPRSSAVQADSSPTELQGKPLYVFLKKKKKKKRFNTKREKYVLRNESFGVVDS